MGEYTKNLQLYKVDTVEDANNTFNIETMLNDNWDKIDEKLEKLPVQNGGLYINSETTEEDKAEAQEALKEIGGFLPLDGSVPMSGKLRTPVQFGSIGQTVDNRCFRIDGGSDYDKGAFLTLFGKDNESGRFQLVAVDGTNRVELEGHANGVLNWNGKQLFNVTKSTTDLTAGSSQLDDGCIHLVYE